MEKKPGKIDERFKQIVTKTSNLFHSYYAVNSVDGLRFGLPKIVTGTWLQYIKTVISDKVARIWLQLKWKIQH